MGGAGVDCGIGNAQLQIGARVADDQAPPPEKVALVVMAALDAPVPRSSPVVPVMESFCPLPITTSLAVAVLLVKTRLSTVWL